MVQRELYEQLDAGKTSLSFPHVFLCVLGPGPATRPAWSRPCSRTTRFLVSSRTFLHHTSVLSRVTTASISQPRAFFHLPFAAVQAFDHCPLSFTVYCIPVFQCSYSLLIFNFLSLNQSLTSFYLYLPILHHLQHVTCSFTYSLLTSFLTILYTHEPTT